MALPLDVVQFPLRVSPARYDPGYFFGLSRAVLSDAQPEAEPAYQALIPSLVDEEDLPNAIALMSIQFNLASVIGRAIGGVSFAALGAAACFYINGLSFLAVIVSLFLLPVGFVPSKQQANVLHSLKEGVRFVVHKPAMRSLVVLAVCTAMLGVPMMTLLPVFARDVFGLNEIGFVVPLRA